MVTKSYKLLGSDVKFFVDADELISVPIMDEAYELSLRLQKIFNIYDESSEISMLNKQRHLSVSDELLEVLLAALRLCELSDGEYDISLGRMFLQRKHGEELDGRRCSYKDISVSGNYVRLLNDDVLVDLGSIAKGYIAERISKFFVDKGIESGYVDARGDIKVFGDSREVGVQHPRNDGLLLTLKMMDKGVATSGDYRQYHDVYSKSHILNQKDIISATVVADSLMNADAYATILMVCDKDMRESLIGRSGLPAMTIDKNLSVTYYNGFEKLVKDET
jgi:thiamine biosynthesis lipoprotein